MQHGTNVAVATDVVGTSTSHLQHQSPAGLTDTTISSSATSPKFQRNLHEAPASQSSGSTLPSVPVHELTPPSSVASSQEQRENEKETDKEPRLGKLSAKPSLSGKKRTANGQVKEMMSAPDRAEEATTTGHARNLSAMSYTSTTSLGELSQQLRTKLTYAMVKVQNGWQKHSLDEIESITFPSPRSNLSGFASRDCQALVSPRTALAAGMRQNSDASTSSDRSSRIRQPLSSAILPVAPVETSPRKSLAPPAPILASSRRRPIPNMQLQINSSLRPMAKPLRPTTNQRTPSQNAAMEADAVETLLFMSASPSNSGHFPSHLSAYSPTSQAFSTQTSPLKAHFSMSDRNQPISAIDYSPQRSSRRVRYEDKAALIDRLLHDLDDDESEELDRAMKTIEQHQAAKMSA